MTRSANARVAASALLLYIAAGITAMILTGGSPPDIEAILPHMAAREVAARIALVLWLVGAFCALALAVTFYSITRDEDHELAALAMACRISEGVIGGAALLPAAGMLWLATATGAGAPDPVAAQTVAGFITRVEGASPIVAGAFFAVGSTIFSWLFLRGRMIPVSLAWLGVVASVLLVVGLPLRLAGVLAGPVTQLMWVPMAAFEVPLAFWLLIKGVATARTDPAIPMRAR